MPLPIWAVALAVAFIAPFVARGLAVYLERHAREQGRRILAARQTAKSTIDDTAGTD